MMTGHHFIRENGDLRSENAVLGAKSGEIAHINRSKPHSKEGENAGQGYCTSSVRHGPVSAQFSLRISEQSQAIGVVDGSVEEGIR